MMKITNWAMMGPDRKIYYSCEYFFGIQKNGKQLFSGESDRSCYYEIAQQLWAIMKGYGLC